MDRDAGDLHRRAIGREAFAFDLAQPAAVERIGEIRPEVRRQAPIDAAADLLVGGEGDADFPVRDRGIGQQVPRGGHDDGDAGLVVSTKQRGAARGDDVIPGLGAEIGRHVGRQRQARRVRVDDRAAVVAPMDPRLDAGRVELRRGVDMRDEADDRRLPFGGRRDRRQHRAIVGQPDLRRADGGQFIDQEAQEDELGRCAWRGARGLVALRVDRGVAQEPRFQFGVEFGSHGHLRPGAIRAARSVRVKAVRRARRPAARHARRPVRAPVPSGSGGAGRSGPPGRRADRTSRRSRRRSARRHPRRIRAGTPARRHRDSSGGSDGGLRDRHGRDRPHRFRRPAPRPA